MAAARSRFESRTAAGRGFVRQPPWSTRRSADRRPHGKTRFTAKSRKTRLEAGMSKKLKADRDRWRSCRGVPVASVLGNGAGQPSGPGPVEPRRRRSVETSGVHQVAAPSTAGAGAAAKGHSQTVKLAYFETPKKTVKPGRSGLVVGPVPKHCHVLNGYYFLPGNLNSTAILSMGDSPGRPSQVGLLSRQRDREDRQGHQVRRDLRQGAGIIAGCPPPPPQAQSSSSRRSRKRRSGSAARQLERAP